MKTSHLLWAGAACLFVLPKALTSIYNQRLAQDPVAVTFVDTICTEYPRYRSSPNEIGQVVSQELKQIHGSSTSMNWLMQFDDMDHMTKVLYKQMKRSCPDVVDLIEQDGKEQVNS